MQKDWVQILNSLQSTSGSALSAPPDSSNSLFSVYAPTRKSVHWLFPLPGVPLSPLRATHKFLSPFPKSLLKYYVLKKHLRWQGKFGLRVQNEAGQRLIVLPRECTGHSKHLLPTTQEKTLHIDITRWSTPKSDWLCSLQPKTEKLYKVSKNRTRSWLWFRSWPPYCQIQT